MNNLIDWAEQHALENIRFHLGTADTLAKEATTTLTLLLAGVGGTMAHAMQGINKETMSDSHVASIVLAVYLVVISATLVYKCMRVAPIPAPTNEPKNIYQPNFKLDDLREAELNNLQTRIDDSVKRNDSVATWLNLIRFLAVFSPVIWVLVFYL